VGRRKRGQRVDARLCRWALFRDVLTRAQAKKSGGFDRVTEWTESTEARDAKRSEVLCYGEEPTRSR
jgi:hypothetical protein